MKTSYHSSWPPQGPHGKKPADRGPGAPVLEVLREEPGPGVDGEGELPRAGEEADGHVGEGVARTRVELVQLDPGVVHRPRPGARGVGDMADKG